MRILGQTETLIAFCDNDPKKQATRFKSLPVIAPAEIPKTTNITVLIASQYSDAICNQLRKLGISESNIEIVSQQVLSGEKTSRSRRFCRGLAVWLLDLSTTLAGALGHTRNAK